MTREAFQSHSAPFGEAIPSVTPHAVSVSLPTIRDVELLFRRMSPEAWDGLETIYPRFGDHPFVKQALSHVAVAEGRQVVALSSPAAAESLAKRAGKEARRPKIKMDGTMAFLSYTPKNAESVDVVNILKTETGWVPSSRRAEDYLIEKGDIPKAHEEAVDKSADHRAIETELQRIYLPAHPEVYLANSGMSAVTAAVDTLHTLRNADIKPKEGKPGRDTWIILGTPYHDTYGLLSGAAGRRTRLIPDPANTTALGKYVHDMPERIAGVITETPTNPLIAMPDLASVREVLGDIPLVVDVSTAGSMLVDAMPYADVVVESLTKNASGQGDVLMGAILLNPQSQYYGGLHNGLQLVIEPPYIRDVQRLAHEMKDWRQRAERAGGNVLRLAEFFENHNKIKSVYWTGSGESRDRYADIARGAMLHAGVITVEIKRSLRPTYDRLDLAKGPSFGTAFTLNTPYVQITHAMDILSASTRRMLEARTGLNPRLLRVSVGGENPEWLKDKYGQALAS